MSVGSSAEGPRLLAKDHALIDGNKRLSWVACAVFLDLNGIDPTAASNDDVFELVMRVAPEPIEVTELAAQLRSRPSM